MFGILDGRMAGGGMSEVRIVKYTNGSRKLFRCVFCGARPICDDKYNYAKCKAPRCMVQPVTPLSEWNDRMLSAVGSPKAERAKALCEIKKLHNP